MTNCVEFELGSLFIQTLSRLLGFHCQERDLRRRLDCQEQKRSRHLIDFYGTLLICKRIYYHAEEMYLITLMLC